MGLLDFDDTYKAPYSPRREERKPTEEEKQALLNNLDRPAVTEDYSDSPHADRI